MNINHIRKTAETYINNFILPSDPLKPLWNRENFIFAKKAKWNYIDNCLIRAVLMIYSRTENKILLDYAVKFINSYVSENGDIPTMNVQDFNLDNICGCRNLVYLYNVTGDSRYKKAYEKIYKNQLVNQPRLKCGNFWHKAVYPHQLWLDGAYMAIPFMCEYAIIHDDMNIIRDAENQLNNIYNIMRDKKTGLYYHGYDETKNMFWADKNTGLSPNFWLRSMGWLSAGLADICEILPECKISRDMLSDLLYSLEKFSDSDGMLFQLPAKPYLTENYPETSGTLLFAYSCMKAQKLEICNIHAGEKALSAVESKFIRLENNIPVLGNICLMGGLGGSQNRDGSENYYISEKIVENDAKGIAPFLMAYNEYLS
ncbi:MAG TPA: glycosyl hydrolase [Ruminococcus sp.]|nr:glycosyl hydrolase [Ruminococcus sp.]